MEIVDNQYANVDPLKEVYRDSVVNIPERIEAVKKGNIALLCIDLQYLDAARGEGIFKDPEKSGVDPESQEYYFYTLENSVIPNVRRLQDMFRRHNLEVIHIRIQSLTKDGRDRSPGHKRLDLLARPGSREAEFLEEIGPIGDEIIVNKTASGVFNATNLEYILRNLEIDSLFITGVYSNECVSTTVRDACDLGFMVTLVEDACTTVTPQLQEFTINILRDRYARIVTTEKALEYINYYHIKSQ